MVKNTRDLPLPTALQADPPPMPPEVRDALRLLISRAQACEADIERVVATSLDWHVSARSLEFGRTLLGSELTAERWDEIIDLIGDIPGWYWGEESRASIVRTIIESADYLDEVGEEGL